MKPESGEAEVGVEEDVMYKVSPDSSFYGLYRLYNTGAKERDKIEREVHRPRRALLGNVITADEFDWRIRGLVRNLSRKNSKRR